MIPLRDTAPRYTAPLVTVALIVANVFVFLYQLTLDPYSLGYFLHQYGVVPLRFAQWVVGSAPAEAALVPLFTSMFLHGGFLHLIGNMWFLWIFGDNVEDQLGHFRYLLFYVGCGLVAAFSQMFLTINSRIPSIGASGAIAGVMGAYLVLFPGARVLTLIPFFLIFTVHVPAWVMLFYWIGVQVLSGLASSGAGAAATGGTAWWAHVGGFVCGIALVKMMGRRQQLRRYYEW
jgi:membrane associated rhomboid family serine protease